MPSSPIWPPKIIEQLKSMPAARQRQAVGLVDPAHRRAEHAGGVEHAPGVPDRDRLAAVRRQDLLDLQDLAHRLRIDRLPADSSTMQRSPAFS